VVEAPVDVLELPTDVLAVLHPLEVAHGHPAGVHEDVREDDHATVVEDLVGTGRDRMVRSLDHDPGPDAVGVVLRDDLPERGSDEHVDVELEQLRRR
jgi:hypothetical protein